MTDKTIATVRELLIAEQDLAANAIADEYKKDGSCNVEEVMLWTRRLADAVHADRDLSKDLYAIAVQQPIKREVEQVLTAADLDTAEHDFIVNCLKAAIDYCYQQYHDSDIDWLPSASEVGLSEDDKFKLLKNFLNNL